MSHEAIDQGVDAVAEPLAALARSIHDEPELAFQEHRSVDKIASLLESHGAVVERPFGGLDTAFRARLGDGKGPHVAILAEYDALPEIGHACGHNLIAAGATGAWLALQRAGHDGAIEPSTIDLIGTPAEEGGGGKIRLLEAGAFEGVDAAIMFHPFDRDLLRHPTLATEWLELSFEGKPSHAAIAPEAGRSALTACMDTFRLIDGQRIHLPEGARVHGIITDGGQAVNIIVERAVCEFSIRAWNGRELAKVRDVVERCARGAAVAADVNLKLSSRQGYLDMRNNAPLASRFGQHLEALGRVPSDIDPNVGSGSTDMGDVSHHVPAIHPWLAICGADETTCHQRAFARCARSDRGIETMLMAAKCMARIAYDVIADGSLREQARACFDGPQGVWSEGSP